MKNADAYRSGLSAAVGPATSSRGFNDDVESLAPFSRSGRGAIAASVIPEARASVDELDADPGADDVQTHMSVFTFLKIVTAIAGLYMCTNPWFYFYDADKGEICPYTVICATTPLELVLLTGSRISAGVLYASLTISIFSKCYATRSYLHHSWIGAVLDFEPTHDIHTYFGYLSLVAALEHAILHCARFTVAGDSYLIYGTDTGRSGLVGVLLMFPIVLPMKYEFIRTKMTFENRKLMHLLFLPLIIALCFHSVQFRYVGTILIVWYILDRLYFTTKQTFLITHPVFEAVGRGTMVTLDLPLGYSFKAGSYIYVNSPTIARSEWHPFSIIQVPGKANRAAFYVEAVGDWTQDLFHLGLEQPRLPLWITAAQPSIMEKSIYYDNIVLVCTGAGITPAVSIIARFAKRKNIHLLWVSRDGGMVALFEKQLRQVNSMVHLTGKQTEETKAALQRLLQPTQNHGARATAGTNTATLDMSQSVTFKDLHHGAGDEKKTSDGDAGELHVPAPIKPTISDSFGVSTTSTRRLRRVKALNTKPADPVGLRIGRPDIGAYLAGTFATKKGAPQASRGVDESGMDTTIGRVMDRSKRLDSEQAISKETLMRADAQAVAALQQKQGNAGVKGTVADGNSSSSTSPWLVLYCGANPKVEEAIANKCDELKVDWQKEYFGAW